MWAVVQTIDKQHDVVAYESCVTDIESKSSLAIPYCARHEPQSMTIAERGTFNVGAGLQGGLLSRGHR